MSDTDLALRTDDSPAEKDLQGAFPAILVRAGANACLAADEFFSARISNPHTRTAYAHQVSRFLTWCENEGLELHQVTPGLAGRFLDARSARTHADRTMPSKVTRAARIPASPRITNR